MPFCFSRKDWVEEGDSFRPKEVITRTLLLGVNLSNRMISSITFNWTKEYLKRYQTAESLSQIYLESIQLKN